MTASSPTLADRVSAIASTYEKGYAERGNVTPEDPLEFHLYHLARYWSRLVGFCHQFSLEPDGLMQSDLGACIQVGSERAHRLIGPDSPIHDLWQEYWWHTTILLHNRPTTKELVDAAHTAFESCLTRLKYDPWKHVDPPPTEG